MLVSRARRLRLWIGLSTLALALALSISFAASGALAGVPTGSLAASAANTNNPGVHMGAVTSQPKFISAGSGGRGNPGSVGQPTVTMPLHGKNTLNVVLNSGKPKPLGKLALPNDPLTAQLNLQLDDDCGSCNNAEGQIDFGCHGCNPPTEEAAIWVNRFTPDDRAYPITLNSIQIYWPSQGTNDPQFLGLHPKLLIYQDITGSGDFRNAIFRYESDAAVSMVNAFQTYPVNVTLYGGGDIYVGFEDFWAVNGFVPALNPAALDTNNSHERSWVGTMADGTGWPPDYMHPNTLTFINTLDYYGVHANLMIRASGQSSVATCPGVHPGNPPSLAVIFVPGLNSSLDTPEQYYPLPHDGVGIHDYCVASGDWIQSYVVNKYVISPFNKDPRPPLYTTSLTDRLAAQDAVLLPFSYNGAGFSDRFPDLPNSDLFQVNNWSSNQSSNYDPSNQANNLAQEVQSVRRKWHNAHIVVIGDSGGGLPAEVFWQYHVAGQNNDVRVFSIASPINGVSNRSFVASELGLFGAPGNILTTKYNERFANLRDNDHIIANLDADSSFRALGTRGDKVFDDWWPTSDGLFSSLVWDCNSSGGCSPYSDSHPPSINFENREAAINPPDNNNHITIVSRPAVITYIMNALTYPSVRSSSDHQAGLATSGAVLAPNGSRPLAEPTMLTSDPSGIMSPQVVSPGQAATINGQGFTSTAGQVQFDATGGGSVSASITSWTDTQIGITVPTTATTGLVYVTAPGYPPSFMVGAATLLGPNNGVASLSVAPGAPALWNQPITITVTARDGAGQPLPNKPVAVSVGVTETVTQTGSSGTALFPLIGINPQNFVVHSGNIYTSTTVTWQQPPTMTLTLNASSVVPSTGAPITVTAVLSDVAHNPVPNQPVSFNIIGSGSLQLSATEAWTDQTGTATTTVTNTGSETFIIGAVADDYTASADVVIRPLVESWLVGHATWQGRLAQPSSLQQLPITLTLKLGSSETNYQATNTTASGLFTVSVSGLLTGTYNWRVKGPKYLANSGTVTLTGTLTTNLEIGLMKAGDCNNDNLVNVQDFNILKPTFGKQSGDPGYDDRADFTGDQIVNILDFNLLKGNFGQGGAPPIRPGGR